jgi:uncharacterized protein with GYD domain
MAKYLIKASYTPEGTAGLLRDGGSKRRSAVQKMVNDLGGKLESFYYAFGEADLYSVVDLPDATSIAALSLSVNAAGAVRLSVTALLTPEEIDAACKKSVNYQPPGT